jgi:hypothetical protein
MEAIKDTVQSIMQGLASKRTRKDTDGDPEALLKKLLTKKELEHIKFNYFKKGMLSVNVDSSAWLYSLTLKKEELLGALKKNSPNIKDIRFRIGETK